MFSLRSLGLGIPAWLHGQNSSTTVPSVHIYDVEDAPDRRTRTLKHLVKANHINYSIIYNDLRFHNHCPHILGSTYILGGDSDQLNKVYDSESKDLEQWKESPGEVSADDWRGFLGKRDYQRAYIDFFEDQLVQYGFDWRALVEEYLFTGAEPLINNLVCGLAHPLIHLGYAYELSSPAIAIEALALTTCFYNDQHRYLDDPQYTKPGHDTTADLLLLIDRIARDRRFDDFVDHQDSVGLDALCEGDSGKEKLLLEYWNDWEVTDADRQLEDCQRAAAALLVGTLAIKQSKYDFYLCHALTSSHAIRILLPTLPTRWHKSLVRQWWLFALSAYVMEKRPRIHVSLIEDFELHGRGWEFVVDRALNSEWSTDAHFVKACRAFKVAAETWHDAKGYYLKAAVKFVEEFDGWGGASF